MPRPRVRWAILALLFFSTVLNYVDRQTLSILATTIQKDLAIDDIGYAHVVQLFLIAYTLAYFVVGWLTDRLGSKLALALFVGWWSIANMMTGLVHGIGQLGAARFALGLGEAGNYVAAPKAVSEHYAPHERGFAVGVYTAGAMAGATIAPPLIGWLALGVRGDGHAGVRVDGGVACAAPRPAERGGLRYGGRKALDRRDSHR
jgi:ACS family hexuronate transporter-like MFS transporter